MRLLRLRLENDGVTDIRPEFEQQLAVGWAHMPLAEEILVWAGLNVPNGLRLPGDDQIRTTCPTCDEEQALSEADVAQGAETTETTYTCRNGCQPIVVIGSPGDVPWPGRGYRMGDWSLRNPADLTIRFIDQAGQPQGAGLLFPASENALKPESEAPEPE
jgi:hypothetical protein